VMAEVWKDTFTLGFTTIGFGSPAHCRTAHPSATATAKRTAAA